jgi:hypothetical protein
MNFDGGAATGTATAPERPDGKSAWGMGRRLAFRLVFLYLAMYMIVGAPLGVILSIETGYGTAPGGIALQHGIEKIWNPVASWVGGHLVRAKTPASDSRSDLGDLLTLVTLSTAAALGWAIFDRRAGRDVTLYRGMKVVVRYVLAFVLVLYGMDKVVPNAQFPFPTLETMVSRVGELSVYRLFWASMGTSTLYAFFGGAMEIAAAGLLLFSRTTVFGALLALSAMANVAVLNLGFDIPVKNFSIHLVLMAVFVLAGDFVRLTNFLLLDRPADPGNWGPAWRGGWFRIGRVAFKAVFILYVMATSVQACLGIQRARLTRSPLYGIYQVEEFTTDGIVRAPLTTDAERWRTVVFNSPGRLWIRRMDDSVQNLSVEYDPAKSVLNIAGKSKGELVGALTCSRPGKEQLVLQGTYLKHALVVKLARVDESKFALPKSRVHWILDQE